MAARACIGGNLEEMPGIQKIEIRLDQRGGELFAILTAANIENHLAMVLDGKVISAPMIRDKLSREMVITGTFSEKEAKEIAVRLQAAINANKEPTKP